MKVEILREKENKVLKRREVDFRIEHLDSTTPSRADVRAKIAAQLNADPSAVVVKSLATTFGIGVTEGSARIYADLNQAKRVEIEYVLKRHEPKAKKGEGEQPAEGAEEKAPAKPEKKKPEKKEVEAEEEVAEEAPEIEEAVLPEAKTEKGKKKGEAEEAAEEKAPGKKKEAAPPEKRPEKGRKVPGTEEKAAEKAPEKKKEAAPAEKKEAPAGKKKGKGEKEES